MSIIPAFIRRRIDHNPSLLRIADNFGWLLLDKIVRMGVGLIIGVWIARHLGPQQFGLLNFTIAFIGLFSTISGFGLQSIIVRDIIRDPDRKGETLATAVLFQLAGGIVAYALCIITIFSIRPEDAASKLLAAILGLTMFFAASQVFIYWFESQVQSKYTVWVQNGSFLIFAVIKTGLILNNSPLTAFAWAIVAEAFASAAMISIVFIMQGPRLGQFQITLRRIKRMLADCWPLLLSGIAISIYMKIDQIMLGQLVNDEAVGIYSAAVRVSEIWYFIPVMIASSVFPAILHLKMRSESQYKERLQHLYDLMVWLSVGIALPMTFLSTQVVTLLFGNAFVDAGPVLAIHIWSSVFVFLGVIGEKSLIAENRQILSFQRTALGAVINIGLNFILIPKFGAIGAATATLISQAIAAFAADLLHKDTRNMFFMKLSALNASKLIVKTRSR